jgi:threonine dehydratase
LSQLVGKNIYIKKENLQVTGSFKVRGAFSKISALSADEQQKGVVAASAGNHAQGVALSAQHFEIAATIVMPDATPLTKINGVKSYGAEVILHGANYDEAYAFATTYAKENNRTFIHPFEDDEVITGQGTIALEILEEIDTLDAIVVPVGGGGLIAGISKAIKAINPSIDIIGVSAEGAPAFYDSYQSKIRQDTTTVRTIADGIAVRDTSEKTLDFAIHYVDQMVTVDDEEIASAILFLLEGQKLVTEGAGAVGIAALMHQKIDMSAYKNIAVVLSGGNIDVTMLSVIIEKGLIKSSRKMKLEVELIDKPGSLHKLTQIFTNSSANIVHIGYDRTSTKLAYGDAYVTIDLETKGEEHQEQLRNLLHDHGYKFKEVD